MRGGEWSGGIKRGRKLILTLLINPPHQLCEVGLLIPQPSKLQFGEMEGTCRNLTAVRWSKQDEGTDLSELVFF